MQRILIVYCFWVITSILLIDCRKAFAESSAKDEVTCRANEMKCPDGKCIAIATNQICANEESNYSTVHRPRNINGSLASTFRQHYQYEEKNRLNRKRKEMMGMEKSKIKGDVMCSYSPWTDCSSACVRTRIEKCKLNGKRYTALETVDCNRSECEFQQPSLVPVNGSWSEWGLWSPCSKTCGKALRRRQRTCNNPPPSNGGDYCQGLSKESSECEDIKCPVNGHWGNWTEWSKCKDGTKHRHRACDNPAPENSGKPCRGKPTQARACIICAESLRMSLTPGRVKCRLGKPTNFTCIACTSSVGYLIISMDTVPVSTLDGTILEKNITEPDTCLQHSWVVHLNEVHKRVICSVKNAEEFVIGALVSKVHIENRGWPENVKPSGESYIEP